MDKIATLKAKLKKTKGLWRIPILNELAKAYLPVDAVKSREYADKALALVVNTRKWNQKAMAYHNAAQANSKIGDYEQAAKLFDQAIQAAQNTSNIDFICQTFLDAGNNALLQINFSSAINYFHDALRIAESAGLQLAIYKATANIGMIYGRLGDFEKSLKYFHRALENARNVPAISLSHNYSNIGLVFTHLRNYEQALKYHHKAIEIQLKADPLSSFIGRYNNIGCTYIEMGELDKALEYFQKALRVAKKENSELDTANLLSNIGTIYVRQKQSQKAFKYLLKAEKLRRKIGDDLYLAITLSKIGDEYITIGEYKKAHRYLQEALQLAREVKASDQIKNIHDSFAQLYKAEGNYSKAFESLKKSQELMESIFSEKTQCAVSDFQARSQIEKLENENSLLKNKIKFQKLELSSMANSLYHKSEIISELRQNLGGDESQKKLINEKELNIEHIKDIFRAREDWLDFKNKFENTYPDFLSKLKKMYPALTKQELKICSLIKVNLTAPMIAQVLFLSRRNIENHRYRIRKKLRLSRGDDLFLFLDMLPLK